MLRALPVVLVLAVLSLAFAVPAHAVLITVNFTVTGPANDPTYGGDTANGSFSFDSSLIPSVLPGTLANSTTGLDVSYIDFIWAGHTWSTADADATILIFDAAGNLTDWQLAGVPAGLSTISSGISPDIRVSSFNSFAYTTSDSPILGIFNGSLSWSVTTGSAPEPASWLLLGGALVGLVGVRRRARK